MNLDPGRDDSAIDDMVQEAWVKILRVWPKIAPRDDPFQYALKVGEHRMREVAKGWFGKWRTRHLSLETPVSRERSDDASGPTTLGEMIPDPRPNPEEALLLKERAASQFARLAQCVQQVTPELVRTARERLGWRQRDLAFAMGTNDSTVLAYEKGRMVNSTGFRCAAVGVLAGAWAGLLPGWDPALEPLARLASERLRSAGYERGRDLCRKGLHEMTVENTVKLKNGYTTCRACRRAAQARHRERLSEKALAYYRGKRPAR